MRTRVSLFLKESKQIKYNVIYSCSGDGTGYLYYIGIVTGMGWGGGGHRSLSTLSTEPVLLRYLRPMAPPLPPFPTLVARGSAAAVRG